GGDRLQPVLGTRRSVDEPLRQLCGGADGHPLSSGPPEVMRREKVSRRKPMSEINVVPYIDVMLVLLVIFMVTAPILTQGVVVDLPKAPSEPVPENKNDPFVISMGGGGGT